MDEQQRSDLGMRVHALPPELRSHIFSFLLVRPVKWDSRHLESCEKSSAKTISEYTRPSHHSLEDLENIYICAECGPDTHERNWRHAFTRGFEVYVSPWRSKWAPAQTNPYLCTNCYDDRWRPRPFPQPTNLPCLCARRRNLETRLVCRQWNKEASSVFFSENTFAFDDFISMDNFFSAISRQWKTLITKVSLLLPFWNDGSGSTDVALLASSLSILDKLTWLQCLELDAKLLNEGLTASALLNCSTASLRRVLFVVECPYKELLWRKVEPPTQVWRELSGRRLLKGDFAEYVARSMKSQNTDAPCVRKTSKAYIGQQRQLYISIQSDSQLWGAKHFQHAAERCTSSQEDFYELPHLFRYDSSSSD
jgi:hypothetical protein